MNTTKTYLSNFFEEKEIQHQTFEITDDNGLLHIIDTETVIEAIMNSSVKERFIISDTLRKLDYYNQSINEYLKFLAEALVKKFNESVTI